MFFDVVTNYHFIESVIRVELPKITLHLLFFDSEREKGKKRRREAETTERVGMH